jgi:GntR family transcriptional regulator/MocR family aminotransferase
VAPETESRAAFLAFAARSPATSDGRAVRCRPEQIVITGGSQAGLDLVARLLLDPGDCFAIEDPGYHGAQRAFVAAGGVPRPVPVDRDGLDVEALEALGRRQATRLAYVTPSHQYPTGPALSLARRLALVEWASRHGAWIVEDDYDGEFRYAGRPLPSLQGLDGGSRTIYLGSFSRVLYPAIRAG